MKRILVITISIFYAYFLNAQNLILNQGFESDMTNWDTFERSPDYDADFLISTSDKKSGNKSLHIKVTKLKSTYWAFKQANIRVKQTGFTGNKNDVFKISFWAKYNGSEKHPLAQLGLARNTSENDDFWKLEDYDMSNFELSSSFKQYEMELILTQQAVLKMN